ncbi:MAG: 2-dehydropantoate 2-reductase N-terminal domain-containing protein, partial [Alphaproteobacteria bacterium]
MRICIHGAGAIGGTMAARLARAGRDVVAGPRGAHLAASRAHGLLSRERPGAEPVRVGRRCAARHGDAVAPCAREPRGHRPAERAGALEAAAQGR